MDLETYKKLYNVDSIPGWDSLNQQIEWLHQNREPDGYWGIVLPYYVGGEPLYAVSCYQTKFNYEPHYHYISYGLSELFYNESAVGKEFSGFGFELTFRLKPFAEDEENPDWVFPLMQHLARYVFESGERFDDFHYLSLGAPIRINTNTEIQALIFMTDSHLGEIDTPHGKVKFLQMIGITQKEHDLIFNDNLDRADLINKLRENNLMLVTDLERKSIV